MSLPGMVAGAGALLLLLCATLGMVAVIWIWAGGAPPAPGPEDWAALRFTLLQATLSAALSVLLAAPLARALSRRRFPGRGAAIALLGAPFLLPVIVAVLGLLEVWGRSGLVSHGLMALGLGRIDIYGLPGILLAHVFFNLPLATRLFLQGYAAIPAEHWRIAAQLGLEGRALFRTVEWPVLREAGPGAFTLVFLICVTSFAVVLALGGGPAATTLELAIYQAVRFDFDLARAAVLALMQFGLCLAIAFAATRLAAPAEAVAGLGAPPRRWDGGWRWLDVGVLLGALVLLGAPLAVVLARGAAALSRLPAGWEEALLRSLFVALGAASLCLLLALPLAAMIVALERRRAGAAAASEAVGFVSLAAPPFVIGLGLFILIRPFADPLAWALPVTALVNALMSLPFVLRLALPALRRARDQHGRLADQLGLSGMQRLRHAVWPHLRRPLGFAAGLAAALSAGDLGVIALFAPPDGPTLPLLMHRLMGAYRMEAAGAVALVLTALSFGLFFLFERAGRGRAAA